jgi:DNA-directed RNA polymerase I, II, and III subunit RPABC2
MSDYSDSESSVDSESVVIKTTRKPSNKNTIDAYNDDEESDIENQIDDEDEDPDEELETNIKIGGEDSDIEEEEIKQDEDTDIDEAVNNESDNDYNESDNEEEDVTNASSKNKSTKVKKTIPISIDTDDDEEDDDDNYLQKFDNEITKSYIQEYHPECFVHNYEEIAILAKVVKDSNNIIIDPLHKTIPFLTKYEKARILGQRAKQIESGGKPFVRVPENIVDGYVIAELELQQKRIPFIIRRPLPNGACEYWNLKDLENILF